jgi:hypothetical protein
VDRVVDGAAGGCDTARATARGATLVFFVPRIWQALAGRDDRDTRHTRAAQSGRRREAPGAPGAYDLLDFEFAGRNDAQERLTPGRALRMCQSLLWPTAYVAGRQAVTISTAAVTDVIEVIGGGKRKYSTRRIPWCAPIALGLALIGYRSIPGT